MVLAECYGTEKSITELRNFQGMLLESRILEEVYYPLWYYFNACLTEHEQSGLVILSADRGKWSEIRIELIPNENNPTGDTMKAMLFNISDRNGDRYTVAVKCTDPYQGNYVITINCPYQHVSGIDVASAISCSATSYSEINEMVGEMACFVNRVSNKKERDGRIEIYSLSCDAISSTRSNENDS